MYYIEYLLTTLFRNFISNFNFLVVYVCEYKLTFISLYCHTVNILYYQL